MSCASRSETPIERPPWQQKPNLELNDVFRVHDGYLVTAVHWTFPTPFTDPVAEGKCIYFRDQGEPEELKATETSEYNDGGSSETRYGERVLFVPHDRPEYGDPGPCTFCQLPARPVSDPAILRQMLTKVKEYWIL
jgi:hypothetical protein